MKTVVLSVCPPRSHKHQHHWVSDSHGTPSSLASSLRVNQTCHPYNSGRAQGFQVHESPGTVGPSQTHRVAGHPQLLPLPLSQATYLFQLDLPLINQLSDHAGHRHHPREHHYQGEEEADVVQEPVGTASQGPGFPKMLSVSPAPTLHPAVLTALGFTQEHNRVCCYD